jgi:hypothetical protein
MPSINRSLNERNAYADYAHGAVRHGLAYEVAVRPPIRVR